MKMRLIDADALEERLEKEAARIICAAELGQGKRFASGVLWAQTLVHVAETIEGVDDGTD